jgi:hypothetical protein
MYSTDTLCPLGSWRTYCIVGAAKRGGREEGREEEEEEEEGM